MPLSLACSNSLRLLGDPFLWCIAGSIADDTRRLARIGLKKINACRGVFVLRVLVASAFFNAGLLRFL